MGGFGWRLGATTTPPPPTPAPVLTGIWAWFDAGAGFSWDEFFFIGGAIDQSGNARNITTAAISGPLYIPVGIGGLPTVEFDGNNGLENIVDNIPLGARTIMCVAQPDGIEGGSLIAFRRSSRDWTAYGGWLFAGVQYVWTDAAVNINATAPVDYSAAPHVFTHLQTGANALTFKVDNATVAINTPTSANEDGATAGFTLGGRAVGSYLQGWLGRASEWLIYDRELTTEEQDQNMAYFTAKYSL